MKTSMTFTDIWLFMAKLVQLINICYRNRVSTFVESNSYSRGQEGPEDVQAHQIENTASFLSVSYCYGKGYKCRWSTSTQLVLGLKLVWRLQDLKGRCSANETHSTGTAEFHSSWKPAPEQLGPWCPGKSAQPFSLPSYTVTSQRAGLSETSPESDQVLTWTSALMNKPTPMHLDN